MPILLQKSDGLYGSSYIFTDGYKNNIGLAHGAGDGLFYYGDWIRKPGVAICSCNDGLRPVIMKLEATDEESAIDYVPVR